MWTIYTSPLLMNVLFCFSLDNDSDPESETFKRERFLPVMSDV